MCYYDVRLCFHDHRLGCNAASPEYGNFTFPHRYGISEIRLMQIADADALRISDADGAPCTAENVT